MKKLLYIVLAPVALALLWFAYYTISPLFRTIKVDEALPQKIQATVSASSTVNLGVDYAPVIGSLGHPASGTARIITADGKRYVRYENFKTINGPDLYVYLAKDLGAKEFVSLGTLRATEGNVNYEIPSDVNLSEYPYVMTWCKQFGVLFNYADLSKKE